MLYLIGDIFSSIYKTATSERRQQNLLLILMTTTMMMTTTIRKTNRKTTTTTKGIKTTRQKIMTITLILETRYTVYTFLSSSNVDLFVVYLRSFFTSLLLHYWLFVHIIITITLTLRSDEIL